MGWWEIKDVESGALNVPKIIEREKLNEGPDAKPPAYTPEMLLNGDEPADMLGEVLRKLDDLYKQHWDRPIKEAEARAAWNFIVKGHFKKEKKPATAP